MNSKLKKGLGFLITYILVCCLIFHFFRSGIRDGRTSKDNSSFETEIKLNVFDDNDEFDLFCEVADLTVEKNDPTLNNHWSMFDELLLRYKKKTLEILYEEEKETNNVQRD